MATRFLNFSFPFSIAITITTTSPAKRKLLEDDDDELRRSARACKGRRYQEFKDAVGRRGRRGPCGKSDGESSQHSEDEHTASAVVNKNATSSMSFSMVTPTSSAIGKGNKKVFSGATG